MLLPRVTCCSHYCSTCTHSMYTRHDKVGLLQNNTQNNIHILFAGVLGVFNLNHLWQSLFLFLFHLSLLSTMELIVILRWLCWITLYLTATCGDVHTLPLHAPRSSYLFHRDWSRAVAIAVSFLLFVTDVIGQHSPLSIPSTFISGRSTAPLTVAVG